MRIIKEGDMSRLSRIKIFTCQHCGCEFEAYPFEYVSTGMWRNMQTYSCKCPTCSRSVYLEE